MRSTLAQCVGGSAPTVDLLDCGGLAAFAGLSRYTIIISFFLFTTRVQLGLDFMAEICAVVSWHCAAGFPCGSLLTCAGDGARFGSAVAVFS